MRLMEQFAGVIDELNQAGIEYAVCGGIAMSLHGFTRFTQDIDLLILFEDLDHALHTVKNRGFEFRVQRMTFRAGTPEEMQIQRVSKVEGSQYMPLDLVLVTPALQKVWETRERFDWDGRPVTVISRDGLTTMKTLAGRPQDLVDLKRLEFEDA